MHSSNVPLRREATLLGGIHQRGKRSAVAYYAVYLRTIVSASADFTPTTDEMASVRSSAIPARRAVRVS